MRNPAKPTPIVIVGKPTPPKGSWWAEPNLPRNLTAYVLTHHSERMRSSREGTFVLGIGREHGPAVKPESLLGQA